MPMIFGSRTLAAVGVSLFGAWTAATQAQTCQAPLSPSVSSPYKAHQQVSVAGESFVRDGGPWAPKGLNTISFTDPPNHWTNIVYQTAYQNLNDNEILQMELFGVDTVRFLISETGMDPCNPWYSQAFVNQLNEAVIFARSLGMNVILCIQDELQPNSLSGVPTVATINPDAQTQRVWQVLAPLFNDDNGVLYELYNEPEAANTPANWVAWQTAMYAVAETIRSTTNAAGVPSHNVLIADGLNFALTLQGALPVPDRYQQVAYAIHPYFHSAADLTQAHWDTTFGNFANTHPVIATEWTTIYQPPSADGTYYCPTTDASVANAGFALLQYLQSKFVGITAYAYDFGGTSFGSAVAGFSSKGDQQTSSWVGKSCGDVGYGPGLTLQSWFRTGSVPSSPQ